MLCHIFLYQSIIKNTEKSVFMDKKIYEILYTKAQLFCSCIYNFNVNFIAIISDAVLQFNICVQRVGDNRVSVTNKSYKGNKVEQVIQEDINYVLVSDIQGITHCTLQQFQRRSRRYILMFSTSNLTSRAIKQCTFNELVEGHVSVLVFLYIFI